MRAYIKKLQAKPEDARKRIFVVSLVLCMSFVSFIWVSSFGNKFNSENSTKAQEDVKPFALFGKTLSETYSNITASVGNISFPKKSNENDEESGKQVNLIPVELLDSAEFTGLEQQ